MDSALATIIGAIVGGVIGIVGSFGLQWWTQRTQDERRKAESKQVIANVRLMLHIELQQNLDAVAALEERIRTRREGTPDELEIEKLMRFVEETLPIWATSAWERETAMLPVSLTPAQIRQVADIMGKLAMLTQYHETMQRQLPPHLLYDFGQWFKEVDRIRLTNTGPLLSSVAMYRETTAATWQQCEGLLNELSQLKRGNPIAISSDEVDVE